MSARSNITKRLSERRANAVKKYLMEGSGRTDLTSRGFSFSRPIDTNETEQAAPITVAYNWKLKVNLNNL